MMVPTFHPQDQVILRALPWHPTKAGQPAVLYLPQTQATPNRIHHPQTESSQVFHPSKFKSLQTWSISLSLSLPFPLPPHLSNHQVLPFYAAHRLWNMFLSPWSQVQNFVTTLSFDYCGISLEVISSVSPHFNEPFKVQIQVSSLPLIPP